MQYEYSCSLFSHHLLAKTASKQIRPLHISYCAAQCAAGSSKELSYWAEPSQLDCLSLSPQCFLRRCGSVSPWWDLYEEAEWSKGTNTTPTSTNAIPSNPAWLTVHQNKSGDHSWLRCVAISSFRPKTKELVQNYKTTSSLTPSKLNTAGNVYRSCDVVCS